MSALYDLTLLLDTAAESDRRAAIVRQVEDMISASGEIVGHHDWGVRALAYEIEHKTDAEYHLFQFNGPAALLEQLEHTLRITDDVVRFRIIKLHPGTPPPPDMVPQPPVVSEAPEAAAPEQPEVPAESEAPAQPEAPAAVEAPAEGSSESASEPATAE
jgi:small subunit ribosomal protein S6